MLDLNRVSEQAPPTSSKAVYLLRQLKAAGESITISINGWGNLAVNDDGSFERLLDLMDRLETIESVGKGLEESNEGQGLSLAEAKEHLRNKHGVPL